MNYKNLTSEELSARLAELITRQLLPLDENVIALPNSFDPMSQEEKDLWAEAAFRGIAKDLS